MLVIFSWSYTEVPDLVGQRRDSGAFSGHTVELYMTD